MTLIEFFNVVKREKQQTSDTKINDEINNEKENSPEVPVNQLYYLNKAYIFLKSKSANK